MTRGPRRWGSGGGPRWRRLKALGSGEAAVLGLGRVSERTLKRMAAAWKERGPAGCIDGRWVRAGGGHPSVTEEVREAIFAVRAETRKRSRTSMKDKHVLISPVRCRALRAAGPGPGVLDASGGLAGMVRSGRHPPPL